MWTPQLTRALLMCGAVAGPLFIAVVGIQDLTRAGFDPGRHPLSLLAVGDWGWVQITNFVLTGLLNLAFAVGSRRVLYPGRAATWGPWLIGTYGAGLIAVGVFVTDPASGYPPGIPPESSWHGTLHGLGAIVVFGSLVVACFVFTRWFISRRERGWAAYCAVTGVSVLALFLLSGQEEELHSVVLRVAVVAGWGWASVLAVRLLATLGHAERAQASNLSSAQ